MAWTERQLAMLQVMGVRLWQPQPTRAPATGATLSAAVAQGPAPAPAPSAAAPGPAQAGHAAPAATAAAAAAATEMGSTAAAAATVPVAASAARQPSSSPPGLIAAAAVLPQAAAGASGLLAQMDWAALRDTVAGCRACGLCESRTQTVFGVGHPQARWMVVGEAPGEQEDSRGEPFVGPSGQLLDAMLLALSLSRAEDGPPEQRVYIANALKCRPPRNRNPAADEMLRCEPYLVRQISLLQPRVILAMGRFAVQALLRSSEPIGRLRGRVHRYQGVPLIVTYHPAYLLRSLPDKARAWEDLCLAASVADGELVHSTV